MSNDNINVNINNNRNDHNLWNSIKTIFKSIATWKIHVEPIIFILSFCNTVRHVVSPDLTEDKMSRVYGCPESVHDCKKYYNKKMVLWDQNYEYVNLPIACIAGIIYGSYSDRNGRKLPLLIALLSVFIDNCVYLLIWSDKTDISLYWLYLDAIIVGMMGNFMLLMSCVNAYLADQFDNKIMLSIRMIFVSIIFSLGSLFGSLTIEFLTDAIGNIKTMLIIQVMLILTFILSLFILNNPIPNKQINNQEVTLTLNDENQLEENQQPQQQQQQRNDTSFINAVKKQFIYIIYSFKIFIKNREGHRRIFLYITFFANFLDQLAFGEEKSLIGKYTRLSPFNWDTKEYAKYKSYRPITQIIGMIFGLIVMKYLLKLKDTLIIVFAIGSMALCILVIGLANSSALIYASLAPGSLHGLLNPLTYTFITCLVSSDEIGQTFAVSTIVNKLSGIVQTAVLNNIYTATLDWYQGFVWLVMFVISLIAAIMYTVVHIIAKKEQIGS